MILRSHNKVFECSSDYQSCSLFTRHSKRLLHILYCLNYNHTCKKNNPPTALLSALKLISGYLFNLAMLGLFLNSGLLFAQPSDREKPIEVQSDSADMDNKKGIAIYRGSVVMVQGSTRMTGDVLTIYSEKRKVTRIVAEGNKTRAYFKELQPDNHGLFQAWGYTIDYDVSDNTIQLIRNAEISRDNDVFKGEQINYNLTKQTVSAKGGSEQNTKGRVQMIIQPKEKTKPKTKTKPTE